MDKYLHHSTQRKATYAQEQEPDKLEVEFDNSGKALGIRFNLDDPEYPVFEIPDSLDAL